MPNDMDMVSLSNHKTSMDPMQISSAAFSDLDSLLLIERASFPNPFTKELFESELNQPAATILVAHHQQKIVGYIDFWIVLEEIHLINLAVAPDFRKQGVATHLFKAMLEKGKKCSRVTLEVRVSNQAARRFYEKMDFQVIGARKYYYPDGEEALVMEKSVMPSPD